MEIPEKKQSISKDINLLNKDISKSKNTISHLITENQEEKLPHGARTRWCAIERQGMKDYQREFGIHSAY